MSALPSIYAALERTARKLPDAPAFKVMEPGGSSGGDPHGVRYVPTSWSELQERVRALGTGLLARGVQRGDPVGLLSDNRLEWIVSDLATTSIGAPDVPRGCDTPEAEIAHIFAHAGCKIAFVEDAKQLKKVESALDRLPALRRVIVMDPTFRVSASGGRLEVLPLLDVEAEGRALLSKGDARFDGIAASLKPDDLLTLIYTSGTTGTPKGVELTHANLLHQVEHLPSAVRAVQQDRWLSILPPWHIFERAVEYTCVGLGCATAYSKPLRPILLRSLELEKPTILCAVPRVLEAIYEGVLRNARKDGKRKERLFHLLVGAGIRRWRAQMTLEGRLPDREPVSLLADTARRARARLEMVALAPLCALGEKKIFRTVRERTGGRLRAIVSGGAALPAHLDEFFQAVGIPVLEGYGLTETSPVIAVRTPGRSAPFTVGHLLPGADVEIRDESGNPLPAGKTGRVTLRGAQVMRGYHKDAEATRAVLDESGRFDTGDLGYLLPGGELKLTGRAKDMIVLPTGEKVEPENLEARLKRSPLIAQVLVTPQDDRHICALIVPNFEALSERLARTVGGDAVEAPEIREVFKDEIHRCLPDDATKPYERVRRFKLMPVEWKVGEEMTPTLKLKRAVIRERYREAIAGAS